MNNKDQKVVVTQEDLKKTMKSFTDFLRKHSKFNMAADIEKDLEEENTDTEKDYDDSLEFISNMPVPLFVKDALVHDHNFDMAVAKLIKKARYAESIEEIDILTSAVLRLVK